MNRTGLLIIMPLLAAILLMACTPVAPGIETGAGNGASAQVAIRLGVGFVPNVQFAPIYVGIDQGFYAAEGLDLSLDYGFENDYLKLVGTGAMQFMVGSGDQVVLGRGQGLPVRYVMNWYTRYPVVVFAKAERGIVTPADLAGKTIGIPGPFGATYVALEGILQAAGLTDADVTLESIGFTQSAAVAADTVDAAVDYAVNGPVILAQAGITTTQIALDRYLRIPANGLITNETTMRQDPDLVRKVVRATLKSIRYTLDHPDQAFEISLKFVPEAGGQNRSANQAVFAASMAYWQPVANRPAGATTEQEWQAAAQLMHTIGLVDRVLPVDTLYSNDFLP